MLNARRATKQAREKREANFDVREDITGLEMRIEGDAFAVVKDIQHAAAVKETALAKQRHDAMGHHEQMKKKANAMGLMKHAFSKGVEEAKTDPNDTFAFLADHAKSLSKLSNEKQKYLDLQIEIFAYVLHLSFSVSICACRCCQY